MKTIKIKTEDSGQRLDVFLTQKLQQSRSQLQKKIKLGQIKVNGQVVTVHYFLKTADKININLKDEKIIKPSALLKKIKIIAETVDYLVVNKPAGLVVHPAPGLKEYTLIDWLLEKYPEIAQVGDTKERPGIVHRLDREVSGLLVVARTKPMFLVLKEQFKTRKIEKEYQALVYGRVSKEEDIINFPLERSQTGKMVSRPLQQGGKEAITEFKVLQRLINYTFLQVKIKTGRTHQIRSHLSAYGHPIVGDNLYSTKLSREKNRKIGLQRIFLIAVKLAFWDLKQEKQSFTISLPKELKNILKQVK